MYAVWIKIDGTLPWIELKETYQTRSEAREAADDSRKTFQMKIVSIPEKGRTMATVASLKSKH